VTSLPKIFAPARPLKLFWQRVPWWGQCAALWLAEIMLLSTVGLAAVRLSQSMGRYNPPPMTLGVVRDTIPGIWMQWDSGWYRFVAVSGYAANPESMAFFPVYPFLIKEVSAITGWSEELSAMLIAQAFFLVAILSMYKLARLIRDDHRFALNAVLYMMLFPTSFFFVAGYAESILVAFTILGTYLYIKKSPQFLLGSALIGLAAGARPVGWTAGIIYVMEFIRLRDFRVGAWFRFILNGLLIISGVVLFFYYLYILTGSWTAYIDAHALWQVTWQWPWLSLLQAVELVFADTLRDNWFLYALNLFDIVFALYCLVLTGIAIRWSFQGKFKWSLSVFLVINLIIIFSRLGHQVPLDDMARWALTLFPLFIVLAMVTERNIVLRRLTLFLSGTVLVFLAGWWCTGRWVG
jgi:Gpi18-like mannosyltransferase